MSKIGLITGFEPFAGASLNPSEKVLSKLANFDLPNLNLITEVLPVTFNQASSKLIKLIDQYHPDWVIALGQAEGRSKISIERIAINLADATIADNNNKKLNNQPIDPAGNAAYFSTLPITDLLNKLNTVGIPAEQSLSAGSFVCNHVFYKLQQKSIERNLISGFIHLPLIPEQAAEFPDKPTMEIETMAAGLKIIITELTLL